MEGKIIMDLHDDGIQVSVAFRGYNSMAEKANICNAILEALHTSTLEKLMVSLVLADMADKKPKNDTAAMEFPDTPSMRKLFNKIMEGDDEDED
jgi:hypothetical protein